MSTVSDVPLVEQAIPKMTSSSYVPMEAVTSGHPDEKALEVLLSTDGRFLVGVWSAEPYSEWVAHHVGYEYTMVLQGAVTLIDADRTSRTYRAGEAFTLRPGWTGEYRVDEPLIKHFAFYTPESD